VSARPSSSSPGGRITVALAEDHKVVREGLRRILEASGEFTIIGEAGDGIAAVDLVASTRPRLLVLDMGLPRLGGLEVIRQARRASPETLAVVLSMHDEPSHVAEAFEAGALGYVVKEAGTDELLQAIRLALTGRRHVSPPLDVKTVIEHARRAREKEPDPYDALTPRERAVLQMAAEGLTSKAIGSRLGISHRTAETHRARVAKKLGLRDRTALVRYAMTRGLLPHDGEIPPA